MAPPNEAANLAVEHAKDGGKSNSVFSLSGGKLLVNGIPLLSDVPGSVSFSSFSSICQASEAPAHLFRRVQSKSRCGGFVGFEEEEASDMLMSSLGRFSGRSFVSVFRFKTWWSTMWVGDSGSDLQMETQWVLLDVPEIKSYTLILPLIQGSFRSALHPGSDGHVMICAESGSTQVRASSFSAIAYVHVCDNPYTLMKEAFSAVRVHLNTFRLLEEKAVPPILDKFGWCTWDAFYLAVDPAGVWHGVKGFVEGGGLPPRFLIIDDGWQSISMDGQQNLFEDAKNLVLGGTQMTGRLYRFEECDKFRKYKGGTLLGPNAPPYDPKRPRMFIDKAIELEQAEKARDKAVQSGVTDHLSEFEAEIERHRRELSDMFGGDQYSTTEVVVPNGEISMGRGNAGKPEFGMKGFTKDLRTEFKGLDDIYVWHALAGAWGGVRPGATHLHSEITPVTVSPGLEGTMNDLAVVKIVEAGIGLVHPDQAEEYFDTMHSYLSEVGITGVKVDVIHTLEYVCEKYGGRVELAKAYYEGLTKSLKKNFKGTGLLASMQQCNDFFFLGTSQIAFGRVGDDFWFQDPNGDPMGIYWLQGVHLIHCAYNSMWIGQIIQPDWDMFQSDHLCAKFHAASRAICGGAIYVSDTVGGHDFDLLKKLVFPDGTIPKCQHFALPTRDCLFKNPLFDGKTVLKIWNVDKFGGVIGAFNCQGAGWDTNERRIRGFSHFYKPVSGSVHAHDIEWEQVEEESCAMGSAEEYALYLNQAEKLLLLSNPHSDAIDITINPSSFEIFTYVPVKKLGPGAVKFAPIGLANMFNSGGTVLDVECSENGDGPPGVKIKVKGGGRFLAYSSLKPRMSFLNGVNVGFEHSEEDGQLKVDIPWNEDNSGVSHVEFAYY